MADEKNKNAEEDEGGESGGSGGFTLVEFLLWLTTAIVADIFSIIPYVGVVVSWPFSTFFLIYKWMKGLNFSKTIWASVGDYLLEGVFSTLPANTADVIVTYFLSKAVAVVAKTGAVGELAVAAAGAKGGVGAAGAEEAALGKEEASMARIISKEEAASQEQMYVGEAEERAQRMERMQPAEAGAETGIPEEIPEEEAAPEKPEVSGEALGEEPSEFEKLQKLFEETPTEEKGGGEEEEEAPISAEGEIKTTVSQAGKPPVTPPGKEPKTPEKPPEML